MKDNEIDKYYVPLRIVKSYLYNLEVGLRNNGKLSSYNLQDMDDEIGDCFSNICKDYECRKFPKYHIHSGVGYYVKGFADASTMINNIINEGGSFKK